MYSQTFFTTSVRGSGMAPTTAANWALGVIDFMNPALECASPQAWRASWPEPQPSSRLASWQQFSSLCPYSDLDYLLPKYFIFPSKRQNPYTRRRP
jgi:hypothetical protein